MTKVIRGVMLPDTDGCVDIGVICKFLYHDENFEPCCCYYKKKLQYKEYDVPQKLDICKEAD